MRSKAPLSLMEHLVMILVFALAAALCVQAFALADRVSRSNAARDRALTEAQTAVETLKSCGGSFQLTHERLDGSLYDLAQTIQRAYDEDWNPLPLSGGEEAAYTLTITRAESESAYLGRAEVTVRDAGGGVLARLPAAWQEVGGNG